MENLAQLKNVHGPKIEICISNNNSTDDTAKVIEKWRKQLDLKVLTQSENIGGTLNALAVTREATGTWLVIIGDDDELIEEGFAKLMAFLSTADSSEWILVGVADALGREILLGDLVRGRYDAKSFRRVTLRTGLYRYGFIGMHVFSAIHLENFLQLSPENARPWPHLALFLRHFADGNFQVFPSPVVKQAASGAELFWNLGSWVRINLRKLNIIVGARIAIDDHSLFFNALLVRELYSLRNAKELLLWKALEPKDFYRQSFREHIERYRLFGFFQFVIIAHFTFMLLLYITPATVLLFALSLTGRQNVIENYISEKSTKKCFDGQIRGL
jgi:glycosyltransferase involved in cell wall biosynthesis